MRGASEGKMAQEKTIDVGPGKQAVLKPELAERPPLGPVVAVVHVEAPRWPGRKRRQTVKFLDGLVAAYRIRARDEKDIAVVGEKNRVVVRRRLAEGVDEIRFERTARGRAILYCDRRELENLYAVGILKQARVVWPNREKGMQP